MTQRFAEVSQGTASFSRALRGVAVSSEEHSKSIAELAAVAAAMTDAAKQVSELVGTFKLGGS